MYKTILVHVDDTAGSAQRVDIAARLAIQNDAHLVGAAVTGLSAYFFPSAALDPAMPAIVFPIDDLRAQADRALDQFDRQADQAGVATFERRRIDDEAGSGISLHARYCDLVVLGQTDTDAFLPRIRSDFPEYVVLHSARPVLVVPTVGIAGPLGQRVTVAWNGSSNAVRAITSAISLLRRANEVELVVFNAGQSGALHGDDPGADIAGYLARYGVRVTVTAANTSDEGEALLSFAADKGSDLIVMGSYGHSQFSETLLGGVSRTVLRSSPIPLWLAH